jgi:DnaJ family protein C protein 8
MDNPETGEGFEEFYADLKDTEQQDSVLTPKQQIDRLLRPGATYRNLNPFEVLMIDPDMAFDEAKKKFRRLSFLVHPDKNITDVERAQLAFDAVKKVNENGMEGWLFFLTHLFFGITKP